MSTVSVFFRYLKNIFHILHECDRFEGRERCFLVTNRKNSLLTFNFAPENIQNDAEVTEIGQFV